MPIYNLVEYSKYYSKTPVTLWNYFKAVSTDPLKDSEFFQYKESNTEKTANDWHTKKIEFSLPLEHLSNFGRTLDMLLINCEGSLNLTGLKTLY